MANRTSRGAAHSAAKFLTALSVVPLIISSELPCRGDVSSASGISQPPGWNYPQAVEWLEGPAYVNVGTVAGIKIPGGFKFTGPEGAAGLLPPGQKSRAKEVLGALTPSAGGPIVFFEYSGVG